MLNTNIDYKLCVFFLTPGYINSCVVVCVGGGGGHVAPDEAA